MDHLVIEHLNGTSEKEMVGLLATSTKHEARKVLVAKMSSFIRGIQCSKKVFPGTIKWLVHAINFSFWQSVSDPRHLV
jgi:hypothetical protein